jgi:protein SCO1/2
MAAVALLSAPSAVSAADYRMAVWPPHAESPRFNLTDADGGPRSLADFRGRVVVVFFGFVHCPDACPTELFKLALVMKKLGALRDRIEVLFITLDPQRDTPAVLKSYVSAFDPRFVALTGTTAQIDAAAASFFVQYARVGTGADYTVDHSTATYVIDVAGRLRLVGGMKTTTADYAHDLRALAAEVARPAPH